MSQASNSVITEAAVGIIQHADGRVLLAERPVGKAWAGYWEFPGGKVERGETPAQALNRELMEELGITVTQAYPWLTKTFDYPAKYNAQGTLESPAKTVKLHFFCVTAWNGEPRGLEQQTLCWQQPENVEVAPILPANTPIFKALCLPNIYAITHLQALGETVFFERLSAALQGGLKLIQIREQQLSATALALLTARVVTLATQYGAKVLLNSGALLGVNVAELNVAGMHFNATDLMQLQAKPADMLCGASCHNAHELARAAALELDYVLLSPVKATLSHADAAPLGWDKFGDLIADYPLPVYALGGLCAGDVHEAKLQSAHGVALLRGAWL